MREPVVLCEEWKRTESFPTYCLLEDFETRSVFPTTLHDDPHWTREGHQFVADRLLEIAVGEGILPATADTR